MCPETRNLADVAERSPGAKVSLEVEKGDAEDLDGLVSALSQAYRKFYAWDVIVSQAEMDSVEDGHSRERPIRELSLYTASIPAEDEPHVEKSHATSPVKIQITGAAAPLQRLQWYFSNRRVDWDRDAREPSEDRRLELEAQRAAAVREELDLLHELGFPEIQIREAVKEYIFAPLDRLERYQRLNFVLPAAEKD